MSGLSLIFFYEEAKITFMMTGTHPAWQQALTSLKDEFYEPNDALILGLLIWLADVPLIVGGAAGSGKGRLLSAFQALTPQFRRVTSASTVTTTQSNEQGVIVWFDAIKMPASYAKLWAGAVVKAEETSATDWFWVQQQAQVSVSKQVLKELEQVRVALEQGGLRLSVKRWGFVVKILKTAALVQQRHEVMSEDLWLLPYIIDNHRRYREAIYRRVASILSSSTGLEQEEQLAGWMKQVADIQKDMDETLATAPHTVERLREFTLELRGKDESTYRLLYKGEESHLKMEDYQQLKVGSGYRMVSFYQPQAVLGVSPRVERVEMKMIDSFTLVDTQGLSYFLLTQTVPLPVHFSLLQRSYFDQKLDKLTLQLFEAEPQENVGSIAIGLATDLSLLVPVTQVEELYEEVLTRIKKCKEALHCTM